MKTTQYAGIDYSLGKANRNAEGFHFGVISQHTVGAAWYDNSRGRGRNAKRRAGDIANQMLESNNFQHPDWHRLIRYCEGLDNSTAH